MKAISAVLFLVVAVLVAVGANEMRHWDILTGWKLIAWAFIPLTILLGFTLPMQCKVRIRDGQACGNWAYGLLFGCTKVARHWHEKFAARLQLPQKDVKPVEPPRVAVDAIDVWGFWISAATLAATVIGVIVAVIH
jgi:hypothetical protein